MGMFGTERPKIIINIDSTQDEVPLYYWKTLLDEPEPDEYDKKAPRTGQRVFTLAGKHWIFKGEVNIWKYEDPAQAYLDYKSYEGMTVYVYRHSDGQPIYDQYNNIGKFCLVSVNEKYTDEYNKFEVLTLTFRSIERVKRTVVPAFQPTDIPDLRLWFAEDTLEQLTSNNFRWTDKIGNVKYLEGNYGTGDGITLLNGKRVLHTVGSTNGNMLHNGPIMDYPAFTFLGLIKHDLPQGTEDYKCHTLEQIAVTPHTTFSLGPYVSGGAGSAGLIHRVQDGFSSNQSLGLSASAGSANADTPPHKLTLVVIRFTYGGETKLYFDGNSYYDAVNAFTQHAIDKYYFNNSTDPWNGLLGEFMFYSRILTDDEVNLLGSYYKLGYNNDYINL